jgi:hypothetical protein
MRWRSTNRLDRQIGVLWAVVAALSVAVFPLGRAVVALFPRCPFRVVAGFACPSCGSTRALLSLADGQLLDALAFNPLVTLAALGFVLCGLAAPLWNASIRRIPTGIDLSTRTARIAITVTLLANWVWIVARGV